MDAPDSRSHLRAFLSRPRPWAKAPGWGLATVYGIIRQHGGWLEVESQPGERNHLPDLSPRPASSRWKCRRRSKMQRFPPGMRPSWSLRMKKTCWKWWAQVLAAQGYQVITANSGRAAVEMWDKNQSVSRHSGDGTWSCPAASWVANWPASSSRKNPDLKVIFTSGYSPGLAGKEISLMQSRNFLPKPYSIYKLAQLIRKMPGRTGSRQSPARSPSS